MQSTKSGKILYAYHAHQNFTPASTQKVFVGIAALKYLGPNFQFHTQITAPKNSIINGVATRGIGIRFNGDPSLTVKDINDLVQILKNRGIHSVLGTLIIDDTAYNRIPYAPGWIWDDLSYGYAAPLSANIINQNEFLLKIYPNKKIGARPTLKYTFPKGLVNIRNLAITTKYRQKHCPLTVYSNNNSNYTLMGCIAKNRGRIFRKLAVRGPYRYAKYLFTDTLKNSGIHLHVRYARVKTPKSYVVIADHSSKPLKKIIHFMLKESDNIYADSLLKTLGRQYYHTTGTWKNGKKAEAKILASSNINFKKIELEDGAGLSRYDLVSPASMNQLLYFAYQQPLKKILLTALPISGKDGTLEYRMRNKVTTKRVHAKTGTMTGVSALAGYILTQHYGTLSFTIIVNGFVGRYKPFEKLENRICRYMITRPLAHTG